MFQFSRTILGLVLVTLGHNCFGQTVRLMQSVENSLSHAKSCLDLLQFEEAYAYAQASAPPSVIKYSVTNDLLGTSRIAFDRWEEALDHQVRFEQCGEESADLRINFIPKAGFYGHDAMGRAVIRRSVTRWSGNQFRLQLSGYLEVSTQWPDGSVASSDAVLNATLHEVGHYLGLDDTFKIGHVMSRINRDAAVSQPASEEVVAIKNLKEEATAVAEWAESQVGLSAQSPR